MIQRNRHSRHNNQQSGFSLTELAIVLGVIGVIMAGIWTTVIAGKQSGRLEQTQETITLTVDGLRSLYNGQASITNAIGPLTSQLVQANIIPLNLLRASTTTCNGTTAIFADSAWGNPSVNSCGTFAVCPWALGTNTNCATPGAPGSSQLFSIEFTNLDYGTCIALLGRMSAAVPTGLENIYINGNNAGALSNGLPVTSTVATANCANNTTNIVDFIYTMRAPN